VAWNLGYGLPDSDKEQSMEMKSAVAAANKALRPAQSVISKKCGDYAGNKLLNGTYAKL